MKCPSCSALYLEEADPQCSRCLGTGEVCPICQGMGFSYVDNMLQPCECGLVGRRLARDLAPISALRGRLLDASFSNFKLAGPAKAATNAFNAAVHWAAKCEGWLTVWGPKGNGKCVVGESHIFSEIGMMPIKNLWPDGEEGGLSPLGMTLQGPHGPCLASHVYHDGVKPIVRLQTSAGFELGCTGEHPLWVMPQDGVPKWSKAGELKAGDYVAIYRHAKREAIFGRQDEIKFELPIRKKGNHSTKTPVYPTHLDEEIGYILGILTGDGCMVHHGGQVGLTTADDEILSAYQRWAKRLGLKVNKKTSKYDWAIDNVLHKEWLVRLGLKRVKSSQKEIPASVLAAPRPVVRAFLQGLFDTDGSISPRNSVVEYGTMSAKLAKQVQVLLLHFGIVTRRKVTDAGFHRLFIRGQEAMNFLKEIGFRVQRKQEQMKDMPSKRNTNVDIVPHALRQPPGPHTRAIWKKYYPYWKKGAHPSYKMLLGAPTKFATPARDEIVTDHFFWDKITRLQEDIAPVFDVVVPEGRAFIANGFVSHNTHLAAAAANEVIARSRAAIIINTPEFLNWLKQTFDIKEESAYDRIQKVRAVDVLVIDDLGVEYSKVNSGTSWAQEQLYLVLNYRYEMVSPTFITTNVKIGQLEPRIRSRIQEFEVVHNPAPDYRRGDGKVTDR